MKTIGLTHFKRFYYKNVNGKPIAESILNDFMKDLFTQFGETMIRDAAIIHIPRVVDISLRTRLKRKNQIINDVLVTDKSKLDYNACRKLWKEMYPDKTWKEIYEIPNKPRLYYKDYDSDQTHYFNYENTMHSVITKFYKFTMNRPITRRVKPIKKEMGAAFPMVYGKTLQFYGLR